MIVRYQISVATLVALGTSLAALSVQWVTGRGFVASGYCPGGGPQQRAPL